MAKYAHITEKLRNQTHFLTNLSSIIGKDIYIFYARGYFFRVHYSRGSFSTVDAYHPGEWAQIMEVQEGWNNLDEFLEDFELLLFDFEAFDVRLAEAVRLLESLKQTADQVLCLPDYAPAFYTVYLPFSGFYALCRSTLTEGSIPHLGYYTTKLDIDYRKETRILPFILSALKEKSTVPIRQITAEEKAQTNEIRQKITSLKLKGIHFEANRAYTWTSRQKEKYTLVFSTDESWYLILESQTEESTIIERFPTQFGLLIIAELLKYTPAVQPDLQSPWLRGVEPEQIIETFSNQPHVTCRFGPQTNTYTSNTDGSIYQRYGNQPINFEHYAHFINPCDWYFWMKW